MPYKSAAQRRFMHARHPDIASRWDAEIRTAKKKGKYRKPPERVGKKGDVGGWLKPLSVGVAGGALANQFPSYEQRKRSKAAKGKVKKVYAPQHPDDPGFNDEAAQKTFDLIMKMDEATAEMFCLILAGEVYETTIEKNLRTLQRHLDQVLTRRIEMAKRAVMRSISKGNTDGAMEYAEVLHELEEVTKVGASQRFGYQWQETDFRRDPGTGQFTTKIKHTQKEPYSNRVAIGMGLAPTDPGQRRQYARLTKEQKAQYQDEYRQLAGFLNTVTESTGGGDRNVFLRLQDRQGNEFRQPHSGGADFANPALLNTNWRLVGVEATPTVLTAGGAPFGLAQALGAGYGPETAGRMAGFNRGVENLPQFRTDWEAMPADMRATNERLYNRVGAAGAYVGAVAPPGSKAAMAAKMAEIVGSHGAEAEAVIGPTARKTAYRYRGTERTPEKHLVALYGRAIQQAKYNEAGPEEEEIRTARPGGRPRLEETGRHGWEAGGGRVRPKGEGPVAPSPSQMAAARATAAGRAPTWEERSAGRRVIQDQLRFKLPSGNLYNLQAESGNLPPSEGVMLNKNGQIVSQAVGYGDDHYLPFNLKNLSALKGGEYIRTRSVGGLTSEDIYTGLITGARRVTVVSRSGTFSVEFEPDFRGGRRHNDKAMRMTRRYEQLLDAVQSNKVSSGPVPPHVERAIRQQLAERYPYESRAALKKLTDQRIQEYREDPDFGPEDEKILGLVYEQGLRDNPSRDAVEWQRVARNMVVAGKKFNYQLDASGYEAAQDALAEQFPYYIKSQPVVEKEGETVSTEKDKGYVEPGRNRPTGVRAGLFGTSPNQPGGGAVGSQKFSASQADYQRGRIGASPHDRRPAGFRQGQIVAAPAAPAPGEPAATPAAATPGAVVPGTPQGRDQVQAEMDRQDAAVDLFAELQNARLGPEVRNQYSDVLNRDLANFAGASADPEVRARFDTMLEAMRPMIEERGSPDLKNAWQAYRRARGDAGAISYDPRMALHWGPHPMEFGGVGYRRGDSDADRDHEIRRIDEQTRSVVTGLPLSQLAARGDAAMHNELNALRRVRRELQTNPALREEGNVEGRERMVRSAFGESYDPDALRLVVGASDEDLQRRMEDVHRMRALKEHYQGTWPGSEGGAPGGSVLAGGGSPLGQRPSRPDPLSQTMSDAVKTGLIQERVLALRRWRAGREDTDETEGDDALAGAERLLTRARLGGSTMPSEAEVSAMMEDTQDVFERNPAAEMQLSPQERALRRSQPGLFRIDEQGYWHRTS